MRKKYNIIEYNDPIHREQVVSLWKRVFGYESSHNDPEHVIDMKTAVDDGLFWVAEQDAEVLATVMAGYDGHRGWIYSLAVLPECRKQGIGSALIELAQKKLAGRGCIKVNLQILADNAQVRSFYESRGFTVEDRISMGKRL